MVQEPPLTRTKTRLESLPVEIIQEIFLRCLEFNLPRASIHLARAVSNPTIYTWLIRLAFSSTDRGYDVPFATQDYLPQQVNANSIGSIKRNHLRTLILKCRWCTLPLLRKCQKEFISHVVRTECQGLNFSTEDRLLLGDIETRFDNLRGYDKAQDGHRGRGDLVLWAKRLNVTPQPSITEYRIAIWLNLGAVQIFEASATGRNLSSFELPFCEGSELPDKLLCPPWTETKLEFLELLSTRAYIDQDSSYPRAARVLQQVIRARDFATFERLLGLYVRIQYYRFPIPWPVLRVHFQTALRHADERDDRFIRLLIDKRWDSIPSDDIELKEKLLAKVGMN